MGRKLTLGCTFNDIDCCGVWSKCQLFLVAHTRKRILLVTCVSGLAGLVRFELVAGSREVFIPD